MDTLAACRFFQTPRGCLRGDSCTFRHERGDANGQNASQSVGASPWQSHEQSSQASGQSNGMEFAHFSPGNPYANGMGGPSAPCRFYLSEAGCRNGGSCPFAHVGAPPAAAYAQSPYGGMDPAAMGGPGFMYDPSGAPMMMPPPPLPLQNMDGSMAMMGMANASTTPTNMSNASTPTGVDASGKPRRKLDIQANPSKKANYEVISEIMPVLTREIEGPFFAIDVECVATGTGVDDRDVARIAIVNENEDVSYDRYVLPDKPIVSYLTQLTGISESNLVGAPSLAEALVELRQILPRDSVIVGQSIKKDLEWLGLEKEADYKQAFDVADLFRIPMQSKNGTIRYRYFSLRHVAKYLLGHNIQEADHDPVIDAKYAMKIFKQFRHLHESPGRRDAVYQTLLQTPRTPSFAERYPEIDGVLMRVPRKPRENAPFREHSHPNYRDQYAYNSMPPPNYAPDPTLMT